VPFITQTTLAQNFHKPNYKSVGVRRNLKGRSATICSRSFRWSGLILVHSQSNVPRSSVQPTSVIPEFRQPDISKIQSNAFLLKFESAVANCCERHSPAFIQTDRPVCSLVLLGSLYQPWFETIQSSYHSALHLSRSHRQAKGCQ
jgi:hypothetical protein